MRHDLCFCLGCRKRLPDQSAAVSISYLGIGSISMARLPHLPPASVLRRWLKHTSRAMEAAAQHPGQVSSSSSLLTSAANRWIAVGTGYHGSVNVIECLLS